MLRAVFGLALSASLAAADKQSFDCPARALAVEFAAHANPSLSAAHLQEIADALNGSPEKAAGCNVTVPPSLLRERSAIPRFRPFALPAAAAGAWYVDAQRGSDSAAGTQAAPFKTVARALAASRAGGGGGGTIVLRGGTHFVAATLTLTGGDSGLTIQSFPGEEAWLSRGTPLAGVAWAQVPAPGPTGWQGPFLNQNAVYGGSEGGPFHIFGKTPDAASCQAACDADHKAGGKCTIYTWHDANQGSFANDCWFRYDGVWTLTPQAGHTSGYLAEQPNVWVADLSALPLPLVAGLRAPDGSRLWRARYPNFNPEMGFGPALRADKWIQTSVPIQPALEYEPATPNRTSSYSFIHYQGGAGGICTVPGFGFTESFGTQYWCGSKTEGGGAFTWRTPVGLQTSNKSLPHMPYKNAQDAVLQVWHYARWASRMYRMDASGYSYDAATGAATFNFAEGGYQDARGGDGGDWYVENVLEELDAPGEWYFDKAAKKLYVFWNATAGTPPPSDGSVVAIADGAWGLINVTATQAAPLTGLSILGVGFRDTAHVFFAPHSIPSGGDWALARLAALQLEGTEGAVVDSCLFERLDGMAVLLSGYNRNARLTRNSFKWIGDSAMVAWGRTTGDPTGQDGPDGTDGNQPRYTVVEYNIASEVGIWEKQSSLYMQAKTSDSWLHGNVGFNGPRAGVNFNDVRALRAPFTRPAAHARRAQCARPCATSFTPPVHANLPPSPPPPPPPHTHTLSHPPFPPPAHAGIRRKLNSVEEPHLQRVQREW